MTEALNRRRSEQLYAATVIGTIVCFLQLLKFEVVYNSGKARIPEHH
jgi:hypothetical protein